MREIGTKTQSCHDHCGGTAKHRPASSLFSEPFVGFRTEMEVEVDSSRMPLRTLSRLWYRQDQVTRKIKTHVGFVAQGNAGIGAFGPDVFANDVECGHC